MDNKEKKLNELKDFISDLLIYHIASNDEAFDVLDEIMKEIRKTIDRLQM